MNGAILTLFAGGVLLLGYLFYSRLVAQWFGLREDEPTPAHRLEDGIDYVPAPLPVVFGHHFASIAGAGPIIGPILAISFGWLGVFAWLVLGVIFAGGVHDLGAMIASLRHRGRSIGEIIKAYIGSRAFFLFLSFAWATLVLVIAAFVVIVAKTFSARPEVASASVLFLILAVIFGAALYWLRLPLIPATLVGVFLLAGAIFLSFRLPLVLSQKTWLYLLLGYIFIAATTPVHLLLQPRDYLNSFLLYGLLAGGLIGLVVKQPRIEIPAWTGFSNEIGPFFPLLFVITSCGAISGFHSLVASGTTAKQLSQAGHARPVGYGAMLLETVLALVSLMAVAGLSLATYKDQLATIGPIALFSQGVGHFMAALGIPFVLGQSFAGLAVSAFALTSLDTATRVARFTLEEMVGREAELIGPYNRFLATTITVASAAILALSGKWRTIWPIMGSANQLLAALALLALFVWLARSRRPKAFVGIPTVFMILVTTSSLGLLFFKQYKAGHLLLATVSLGLLVLSLVLVLEASRIIKISWKD
ncbi:carbon starvation CstA family protein [Thermosulfuriphilus sp.]